MVGRARAGLTYANVMATAAVFIALGGSSYAAIAIGGEDVRDGSLSSRDVQDGSLTGRDVRNERLTGRDVDNDSLTSRDVKYNGLTGRDIRDGSLPAREIADESLTTSDVRDESLLAEDFKPGELDAATQGRRGEQGARGATGPRGPQGPEGPQGPAGSDAELNGAAAGGDLTGTYPNPTIASGAVDSDNVFDGSILGEDIDSSLEDAGADTPSLRTLGTGSAQAAAGDDPRLTNDIRNQSGSAQAASFFIDGLARTSGQLRVGSESGPRAAAPDYPSGSTGLTIRRVHSPATAPASPSPIAMIGNNSHVESANGSLVLINLSPPGSGTTLSGGCVFTAADGSITGAAISVPEFTSAGLDNAVGAMRADCTIGTIGGHQTELTLQRATASSSNNEWQGMIVSTTDQ